MTDQHAARIRAHRQNIQRYCRLLTGHLTDVERQFVHKRIAEERLELERLELSSQDALVIIAARANGKRGRSVT